MEDNKENNNKSKPYVWEKIITNLKIPIYWDERTKTACVLSNEKHPIKPKDLNKIKLEIIYSRHYFKEFIISTSLKKSKNDR